eukprot:CAMPEP_0201278020 /NCGR_PEP_ID=MMETSP0853-20130426/59896_1 /ASSEMBLY_ACC=CAM_ASM_000640 /TAXON_ID=183588 /ORGANISM="Pseudo-nitzschia fraudulenta, Strain WWA7" /LENGTH=207 /DNA_ID=CAMNT_0047586285 /DNA_START=33 /DNA_END=653 /DNA_ORIENTATION=-
MANAAAKKAAVAKKDTAGVYLPLLVATNLVYLALLVFRSRGYYNNTNDNHSRYWEITGAVVTWIEQAGAYSGILEDAASRAALVSNKNQISNNHNHNHHKRNSKDLSGGSCLDLLAVTILVQFASVLHSSSWFWVTVLVVPVVAARHLYKAVACDNNTPAKANRASASNKKKKNNNRNSNNNDDDDDEDPVTAAKRQRRAEKRRHKW